MARLALGDLMRRSTLLHGLGRLGRDVDGADGLTVRVEGGASVLPLVTGSDGLDEKGHLARGLVVHHLVFVTSLHL